jgi:hypothetical protein
MWFADPVLRTGLRHTYDNAVISLDLMLDALDKGRSAAERLIVMVSDHGATLYDSPALATHDLEIHQIHLSCAIKGLLWRAFKASRRKHAGFVCLVTVFVEGKAPPIRGTQVFDPAKFKTRGTHIDLSLRHFSFDLRWGLPRGGPDVEKPSFGFDTDGLTVFAPNLQSVTVQAQSERI